MTDLNVMMRMEPQMAMIVGVVGLVLVTNAYPVYMRVLKTERERIAPQILQLSGELLK